MRLMRLAPWLVLSMIFSVSALAQPPFPDPGPPQTISLPVFEATLFGHSANPLTDRFQWLTVSGPGPVHFSAPWALVTTVALSTPGTYTFQLIDTNATGSSSAQTTVTLNATQRAFYVDPNFPIQGNGTAALPWRDFKDNIPEQDAQWAQINDALASSDVIIYFSARLPDIDLPSFIETGAEASAVVVVIRTDTGPHRLTLDGMTLYNTGRLVGNWQPNTGLNRMQLIKQGGCCLSLGWDIPGSYDHVTLRGFEITGSGARVVWGGSDTTLEYLWVHDVTDLGATVQSHPALVDGTCIPLTINHEITLRHNRIERGIGEGIYIASNYNYVEDGGCIDGPDSGDNHHDILVEANIIREPGIYGGEGDDVDFKAGVYNVTIRGNFLEGAHYGSGIATVGQMPNSTHLSNYLIESNIIEQPPFQYYSIGIDAVKGAIVRNNVMRNCAPEVAPYGGLAVQTRVPGLTPLGSQVQIYNNTIDGCGGFGFTDMIDAPLVRNNLFMTNGQPAIGSAVAGIDSDFNVFDVPPETPEGPNSMLLTSTDGVVVARGVDDHLVMGSPAIRGGDNLSSMFGVDIEGLPRPPIGRWDVGAYSFVPQ